MRRRSELLDRVVTLMIRIINGRTFKLTDSRIVNRESLNLGFRFYGDYIRNGFEIG